MRFVSIHYKFLALSLFLISVATASYLYLATELFHDDKIAYIYDNNAAFVETVAEEIAAGLLLNIKAARHAVLVWGGSDNPDSLAAAKAVLRDDDSIIDFAVLRSDGSEVFRVSNPDYLQPYGISLAELNAAAGAHVATALPKNNIMLRGLVVQDGAFFWEMTLPVSVNHRGNVDYIARSVLRRDKQLSIFQRSRVYTTYLTDRAGALLAHTNNDLLSKQSGLPSRGLVDEIIQSGIAKGAREYVDGLGQKHIIAYKKVSAGGLYVFSEIPYETAFHATRQLIDKSLWFAVFVFSLSLAFSLLFTRKITESLRRLYNASILVARGDFSTHVVATSRDEVGALATSFNHMTGEIRRLLVETEQKARMEHELKTAQLVQENFFPANRFSYAGMDVSAFFRPATECGGDWWTILPHGEKFVLLLGDATGHGVPAALLTAAAHSCANTLAELNKQFPALLDDPVQIAKYLNATIFSAGRGKVKMTFFVGIFDPVEGIVEYVNAAHEMPIICRGAAQFSENNPPTMQSLDTLDAKPDFAFGESLTSVFTRHTFKVENGDSLVLYTDGLLENSNQHGEAFGERRLLRSYISAAHCDAESTSKIVMSEYAGFTSGSVAADDVTLIVITRRDALALRAAG